MKHGINLFALFLLISSGVTYSQVSVTAATGGTNLERGTCVNGHGPAYTTLGDIVILETLVADVKQSQSNATLILTAPSNWWFNPSVGSVSTTLGDDITAISMAVDTFAITVTLTTANGNQGMNSIDEITISGIQVQSIDGNNSPAEGNIIRSSANAGGVVIDGITADATNFGTLSTDPLTSMPVELVSFTAEYSGGNVLLYWSTATEVNNYGFEVQRSADAGEWDVIGFVQGHGNSYSTKEYEFSDDLSALPYNLLSEILEYRLKQIDTDGEFEYYKLTAMIDLSTVTNIDDEIVPVKFELFQNYPNPFNPSTTIKYSISVNSRQSTAGGQQYQSFNQPVRQPGTGGLIAVQLKVYDMLGKEVAALVNEQQHPGNYEVNFDASGLSSGIYVYKLTTDKLAEFRKMVLLR